MIAVNASSTLFVKRSALAFHCHRGASARAKEQRSFELWGQSTYESHQNQEVSAEDPLTERDRSMADVSPKQPSFAACLDRVEDKASLILLGFYGRMHPGAREARSSQDDQR